MRKQREQNTQEVEAGVKDIATIRRPASKKAGYALERKKASKNVLGTMDKQRLHRKNWGPGC